MQKHPGKGRPLLDPPVGAPAVLCDRAAAATKHWTTARGDLGSLGNAHFEAEQLAAPLPGMTEAATRERQAESQFLLAEAFDCLPQPAGLLRLEDLRLLAVNRALEQRMGIPRAVLETLTLDACFQMKQASTQLTVSALLRDGEFSTSAFRHSDQAGVVREGVLSIRRLESHGLQYAVFVIEDRAEMLEREGAERADYEALCAIGQSLQDALVILDSRGKVSFWGGAAEQMFGYSSEEILGREVGRLFERRSEVLRILRRAAREPSSEPPRGVAVEAAGRTKDGTLFPVEVCLSWMPSQSGRHVTLVMRDITAQKISDAQLRQANLQLSELVARLEEKDKQSQLLSEMREYLGLCTTTAEVGQVAARFLERLFPGVAGALYLLSPSKTELELSVSWGGFPSQGQETVFGPDTCWALRRGRALLVLNPAEELVCSHVTRGLECAYICIPLVANHEVLGLLHLRSGAGVSQAQARSECSLEAVFSEMSRTLGETISLAASNVKLRETLSHQSIRDPLTGLFNRRYLEEALRREIARAARNGQQVSVCMIDVDHFKQFNDCHGHAAGDAVLTALSQLLQSRVRDTDVVGRYGGEEFVVVLTETPLETAVQRAEVFRQAAKQLEVVRAGKPLGPITISIGVAAFPGNGNRLEELLRAADGALYAAKNAGRDRVATA